MLKRKIFFSLNENQNGKKALITYDFEIVKVFRVSRMAAHFRGWRKKKCQTSHYFSYVLHSVSMEIQNDGGSEKKVEVLKWWKW